MTCPDDCNLRTLEHPTAGHVADVCVACGTITHPETGAKLQRNGRTYVQALALIEIFRRADSGKLVHP